MSATCIGASNKLAEFCLLVDQYFVRISCRLCQISAYDTETHPQEMKKNHLTTSDNARKRSSTISMRDLFLPNGSWKILSSWRNTITPRSEMQLLSKTQSAASKLNPCKCDTNVPLKYANPAKCSWNLPSIVMSRGVYWSKVKARCVGIRVFQLPSIKNSSVDISLFDWRISNRSGIQHLIDAFRIHQEFIVCKDTNESMKWIASKCGETRSRLCGQCNLELVLSWPWKYLRAAQPAWRTEVERGCRQPGSNGQSNCRSKT